MERWQSRVAVITGASAGIGAVIAEDLVKAGLVVVALARRETKLQERKQTLPVDLQTRYHPLKCDVTDEEDVKKAFAWVEKNLGGTDILINNAGVFYLGENLTDSNSTEAICKTLDTNVKALAFCVREAFNSMKNRKFDGHVILINSIAGHTTERVSGANMYIPSKHAVTAMAQTYRHEFAHAGTKVKISSISPGAVDTDLLPEYIKKMGIPILSPEDVSNAIQYVIATPPNVQIFELTIEPVRDKVINRSTLEQNK
ncbi:unnamed protein product [Hermetia illucens]|uniref:Farnesol dehydrogenase n=1 Tax=Hermetia illucens TaxID=343691 RepID=A0A7R8UE01_HERIL|nr:farnesol dehydrogenase-like [Hermetia illucens]CAD7079040.1 unnamed protein product [Hermetia illucens]